MSREAWGDDNPNDATTWDETLIRTQMDAAIARFERWAHDFKNDYPNVEFEALVDHVRDTFDEMQSMLSGQI